MPWLFPVLGVTLLLGQLLLVIGLRLLEFLVFLLFLGLRMLELILGSQLLLSRAS